MQQIDFEMWKRLLLTEGSSIRRRMENIFQSTEYIMMNVLVHFLSKIKLYRLQFSHCQSVILVNLSFCSDIYIIYTMCIIPFAYIVSCFAFGVYVTDVC